MGVLLIGTVKRGLIELTLLILNTKMYHTFTQYPTGSVINKGGRFRGLNTNKYRLIRLSCCQFMNLHYMQFLLHRMNTGWLTLLNCDPGDDLIKNKGLRCVHGGGHIFFRCRV